MRGVGRRFGWARANVTKPAGHAYSVRPHEVLVVVIGRVGEIALRIPSLLRRLVEIRVREQSQADDPAGLAVIGADRHAGAARADFDARIFRRVGERISRAIRFADIEQQTEAVWIGLRRSGEAGLVDQSHVIPAVVPVDLLVGIVGNDFQQIEGAEGAGGHSVPEPVIAAGPDDPGVAALYFVRT